MRDIVRAPSLFGLGCLLGLLALTRADASAQSGKGAIQGVVRDSSGRPIPSADVGIASLRQLTRTDDSGRFAFDRVPRGTVELSVRHLGHQPRTKQVLVSEAAVDTTTVLLFAQVAVLDVVDVSAVSRHQREGIEDFHRRRIRGTGTFITREQILARNSFTPSDMLRSVPGLVFVKVRGGGRGVRFTNTSLSNRDCMPMIWIDGQRAPGMEVDELPLTDLEGIELYSGPATTPLQFSQSTSLTTCGTIAVWSHPPPLAAAKRP